MRGDQDRKPDACRRPLASFLGCVIMLMSCAPDDRQLPALALNTGSSVTDILSEDGCGVVVFMSPQECMSCSGILEAWAERGKTLRFELFVVLTSEPSAKQIEALQLRRVPLAGVSSVSHATPEPRAYLFTGTNLTDSIIGITQQTMFLNGLATPEREDDRSSRQPCSWKWDHREAAS